MGQIHSLMLLGTCLLLLAGIPAGKIVYSGVAKSPSEMRFALQQNIHQFNVESEPEMLAKQYVAMNRGMYSATARPVRRGFRSSSPHAPCCEDTTAAASSSGRARRT